MNQPFTASEVRRQASTFGRGRVNDMLRAYADLLEAQEKAVPVYQVCDLLTGNDWVDCDEIDYLNAAHWQGTHKRRRILYTHPTPADSERLAEALRIIDDWMDQFDHMGTGDSRSARESEKDWAVDRAKIESMLAAHSAQAQPSDNRARSLIATWRARATREDEYGEPYESGGSSTRLLLCADELEAALAAHSAQAQPPATSVPGELAEPSKGTLNYEQELSFAEGWNACRKAMLAAQENPNG